MWDKYSPMSSEDFEKEAAAMLPGLDGGAFAWWNQYAKDFTDIDAGRSEGRLRHYLIESLGLVKRDFGEEIAVKVFDFPLATQFCLNPFSMYGAAGYIRDGVPYSEIVQKEMDGLCDVQPPENPTTHEMSLG